MRISSLALASVWTTVLAQQWPIHDNGLNEAVEWDHYSLIVNGERLYMWSGEIHYWRLPVPELWRDVLEKVKVWTTTFGHRSRETLLKISNRPAVSTLSASTATGAGILQRMAYWTLRLAPTTSNESLRSPKN
jgi:hypothetical protein